MPAHLGGLVNAVLVVQQVPVVGVEAGAEGGRPRAGVGGAFSEVEGVVCAVSVREEQGELEESLLVARLIPQHLTKQLLTLLVTTLLELHSRLWRDGDRKERSLVRRSKGSEAWFCAGKQWRRGLWMRK